MKRLLYFALLAIAVVAGILLINTFRFQKPVIFESSTVEIPSNDSAAIHLSNAIQIKTISFGDKLAIDTAEFTKFRSFMETTYPLMHQQLEKMTFNQFSYVFKWKGKDTTAAPYVLMAHMDVVPVEESANNTWRFEPFGEPFNYDTIRGRGTVDDKAGVIGLLEATTRLIKNGHRPKRDIYIAFGHDEESGGKNGAAQLAKYLEEKGVKFLTETQVLGFEKSGNRVQAVLTDKGKIDCEKILLCGGSWSGELAKMLQFSLPMMGGKGYSFIQKNNPEIQQATILTEQKVAVSPYGETIRFGGTMEIAGTNQSINKNRVRGIFESINRYYPDFQASFPEDQQIWKGLRPCSPDGLPYIGFAPGYSNVLVGSGHSMMGISLAPGTGKILAELHQQKDTSMEIKGFEVGRYN